ncbi:MAG: histidine ammonia-lyase [Thermoplasmatota archaeon]
MGVRLDGRSLTRADVIAVARRGETVELARTARDAMAKNRQIVEDMVHAGTVAPSVGITHGEVGGRQHHERDQQAAYGVNTGLGSLATVRIPLDQVEALQANLLASHACGVGEPLPDDIVRAMLVLRANALAVGKSGVRPVLVERIADLLNHGITPVVPSRGSLGASGDLVPLAHASLVLTGQGFARVAPRPSVLAARRSPYDASSAAAAAMPGAKALAQAEIEPLRLGAKEGLALVNGTQLMQSLLALAIEDGWTALRSCEIAGAMSTEALLGSEKPFDPRVHALRPHEGQIASAANLRRLVAQSAIVESHRGCDRVQDAYSLRCMPQVFGAARTALAHAESVLATEMNSATDNPLVLDEGEVISAGNFHGEPLSLVALYVAAAIAEIGSMSERRVARLVDPHLSGLPAFLVRDAGLQSGLMIPQYVAAGLVMENRVLASPAATDSIPTSANQEDHVSNGAVQALNLRSIVRNVETIVAIEALTAAQALDFRAPLTPGDGSRAALAAIRASVPHVGRDRALDADIAALTRLVHEGHILAAVEKAVGTLN